MAISQIISYTAKNVGTTAATVFTAQAGVQTVINGLTVANTTLAATSASVLITRGGTDVYIVKDATVYPGGSMIVAGWDQKIALIAGDIVKAVSSQASSIDVVASALLSGEAAATSQSVQLAPNISTNFLSDVVPNSVITFSATSLPASGTLYWTVEGVGMTTADFAGAAVSGTITITGGAGTMTMTPTYYALSKTWRINIRTGSTSGPIVATSPYITMATIDIATIGLNLDLDAGKTFSYPGSGTTWTDISGSGNNGTLTLGPVYSSVDGGSIVFDGVDDFVSLANSPSLSVSDVFTISLWINASSLTGRQGLFSTRTANPAGCWQLEVGDGNSLPSGISVTGVNTWIFSSNANVITTNKWYHICFAKNGNAEVGGTMYLNGVSIVANATTAYSIVNNTDIKVVGRGTVGLQNFAGRISTVNLYNRALTAGEVLANFNSQRSRYGV